MLNKNRRPDGRNKNEDPALSDMGDKISRLSHKNMPDSRSFKEDLKERLLEARQEQRKSMPIKVNILQTLADALTVKRLVPVVAVLLLVVMVSSVALRPGGGPLGQPSGEFDGYARLFLSPAHAMDNFELQPTDADNTGVAMDSSYIPSSKERIETKNLLAALKITPQVAMEVKQTGTNEWRIDTLEQIPADTLLTVSLDAEYVDETGERQQRLYSWAYQVRNQFKVLTTIPRHQARHVPVNTGIEVMFSHVEVENIEQHFSITPNVSGHFEMHGRTVVFVPTKGLNYGSIYTVNLSAEVRPSGAKEGLAEPYQFSFETRLKSNLTRAKTVRATSDLYEFAVGDAPAVGVYAVSSQVNVNVDIYELGGTDKLLEVLAQRDEIPRWSLASGGFKQDVTGLNKVQTFAAPISGDQRNEKYVQFPESLPRGVYVAEMSYSGDTDQFWIQVTDVAAYANVTMTDTVVWVQNRGTRQPASDITVSAVNVNLNGRTDVRGMATMSTPNELLTRNSESLENGRPYLKLTGLAGELVMELSYRHYYDYRRNSIDATFTDKFWTYLSTDRPRYQTDDTVHVWGVLKPRDSSESLGQVKVTLFKEGYRDYYYRPINILERVIQPAPDGHFTLDLPLKDLRPDYYSIELAVGDRIITRQYVNVEPYEKPAYELTVSPEKQAFYVDEVVPIYIDAKFFDGTPVPNVALIYDDGNAKRSLTTDSTGRVTVNYQLSYSSCGNSTYSCWPKRKSISVRAAAADLGEIAASTSVRVYGPNVYVRSETDYPDAGQAEAQFNFYRIEDDKMLSGEWWTDEGLGNRPAPGTKLSLETTKVTWSKIETGTYYDFINKVTRKTYRHNRNEEVVETLNVQADGNGQYVYRRAVEPKTHYTVKMTYEDEFGRSNVINTHLYYHDGRHLHRNEWWDSRYNLQFDSERSYKVGEQVDVLMARGEEQLPAGEDNQYLFMQLQNGLQELSVGDQSAYSFPFEQRDVPNVHLIGVWFNGQSFVETRTDSGWQGTAVRADIEEYRLQIEIDSNQESYEPGEEAQVSVRVSDADGRPVAASVNLSLIDEAYFAVADGGLPTLLEKLYSRVGSGSFFSESTHEMPKEAASGAEGGGCFAAGTLITMADGSKKPIEQIAEGDSVATFVGPLNQIRTVGEVTAKYEHIVGELLVVNDSLRLTPEHRVFTNQGFAAAEELQLGDWLLREDGTRVDVTSLRTEHGRFAVYNFRVDPQHTYFADGFYVHNDKGGTRSLFMDVAYFGTVTTGRDGRGSVELTLPDNITSWRITAQAVDGDLNAGAASTGIPVTKPVFVNVNASRNYLLGDRPLVTMTAYGMALANGDAVSLRLAAPTLGLEQSDIVKTQAFTAARFALPQLSVGKHDLTYQLETAKGNDAVMLPIDVSKSYLQIQDVIDGGQLMTDTVLAETNGEPAAVVLMDAGQNRLYTPLQKLSWSWGDRVDQKLARLRAAELLQEYYDESRHVPEFEGDSYQIYGGGLTLLPYSDADLELSARLADMAADEFDRIALAQYFFNVLNGKQSNDDEITWALYGLSSLGEPVLPHLQIWSERDDLPPKERLYTALALQASGDAERAREVYLSVATKNAERKDPFVIIHSSENSDEVLQVTALAALVSAALNLPEHVGYWNYVTNERSKELLLNLEQINYIDRVLPNLNPSAVRVKYEIDGAAREAKFTGRTHAFLVEPQLMKSVKFLEIEGDVAYSVRVSRPAEDSELRLDSSIGIQREYQVGGKTTTEFKEGDLVKVILRPQLEGAFDGAYQLTDVLPSGLSVVSSPWKFGEYKFSGCNWRPYLTDGQRVSFRVYKSSVSNRCSYIFYWARVSSLGEFKAEPALLQSFLAPETRNASEAVTVTIE